jgi:hypothetical protein
MPKYDDISLLLDVIINIYCAFCKTQAEVEESVAYQNIKNKHDQFFLNLSFYDELKMFASVWINFVLRVLRDVERNICDARVSIIILEIIYKSV